VVAPLRARNVDTLIDDPLGGEADDDVVALVVQVS